MLLMLMRIASRLRTAQILTKQKKQKKRKTKNVFLKSPLRFYRLRTERSIPFSVIASMPYVRSIPGWI